MRTSQLLSKRKEPKHRICNGSKKEGENMPHPLYPTGYGWMWSDGIVRASDSSEEL